MLEAIIAGLILSAIALGIEAVAQSAVWEDWEAEEPENQDCDRTY